MEQGMAGESAEANYSVGSGGGSGGICPVPGISNSGDTKPNLAVWGILAFGRVSWAEDATDQFLQAFDERCVAGWHCWLVQQCLVYGHFTPTLLDKPAVPPSRTAPPADLLLTLGAGEQRAGLPPQRFAPQNQTATQLLQWRVGRLPEH